MLKGGKFLIFSNFRETFNDMSESQKIRSVGRNLDQLIEELPLFSLRLDDVRAALDDTLEWREFKFCFKVGTSKVVCYIHLNQPL